MGTRVVGIVDVWKALEKREVKQLLVTRRFIELHPDLAAAGAQRVNASSHTVRVISGMAALGLDLAGSGVGAILSRPEMSQEMTGQLC